MKGNKAPIRLKRRDRAEAKDALKALDDPRHDPAGALTLLKHIHHDFGSPISSADVANARRGLVRKLPDVYVRKEGLFAEHPRKGFPSVQIPDDPRFPTRPSDTALRAVLRGSRAKAEAAGLRQKGTVKGGKRSAAARQGKAAAILAQAAILTLAEKPSHDINSLIASKVGVSRDYVGRVRRKKPA